MKADYIIIGSGSAGCAMAFRLSENGKFSVVVIEAGGSDRSPFLRMPAALSYPMNMPKYDWGYKSEPEVNLNCRQLVVPRGKVIGGSSSINGMVFVRGHACDYDHWAESGATGWSYADVLPYFKKMETFSCSDSKAYSNWRGNSGPLHVAQGRQKNPLYKAFVRSGKAAGYEITKDYNGKKQEGFGSMDHTIFKGSRWSASNAYLKPALTRKNVTLIKGFAKRVIIENKCATAVEVSFSGNQNFVIKANKEVILAASSINSPKILMLSGIGPAKHLKDFGIDVVLDRPAVGSNLQDHLEVYVQQACTRPITLFKYWNWWSKLWIGAQWLLTKDGLGSSNHFESAAFVRSKAGVKYPDIQFHFLPFAIRYDGTAPTEGHGFQVHVGPMRSGSRGEVRLRSKKPEDAPKIHFNYMSVDQDWVDFRKSIRIAREIFSQKPFDFYRGQEIQPGEKILSDQELDEFISQKAESAYHPCGTCKMGAISDPTSVVDPFCRVIGVNNLRVVDSSIFPRITNGNINAPSIMVGEKASDHILGRTPLPLENSEPWINPRWQTSEK